MVCGTQCPYVYVCEDEMMRGAAALVALMTYNNKLDKKRGLKTQGLRQMWGLRSWSDSGYEACLWAGEV